MGACLCSLQRAGSGSVCQPVSAALEYQHVEPVHLPKTNDKVTHKVFWLCIGQEAVHRSRPIDYSDVFAQWNLFSDYAFGRLYHRQEEILVAVLI